MDSLITATGSAVRVLPAEVATRHQRYLHRLEKGVPDDVVRHVDPAVEWHAGDPDWSIPASLVEGERGKARCLDPGQPVDPLLDLPEHHFQPWIFVLVPGHRGVNVQAQHIPFVKSGIDMVQVDERPDEEACGHHQHQRKRYLGHHQDFGQGGPATGAAPRPLLRFSISCRLVARSAGRVPNSSAVNNVTATVNLSSRN